MAWPQAGELRNANWLAIAPEKACEMGEERRLTIGVVTVRVIVVLIVVASGVVVVVAVRVVQDAFPSHRAVL